jgi:hypothetical protein
MTNTATLTAEQRKAIYNLSQAKMRLESAAAIIAQELGGTDVGDEYAFAIAGLLADLDADLDSLWVQEKE